jgi:hypothetical protein
MSKAHRVYVALLDEGAECWRPVEAQHIVEDQYLLSGPIAAVRSGSSCRARRSGVVSGPFRTNDRNECEQERPRRGKMRPNPDPRPDLVVLTTCLPDTVDPRGPRGT